MHFVVHCVDKPGHVAVRQANRTSHLAWVAANPTSILIGGPYLSEGGVMVGSMLIAEAPDLEGLKGLLAQDPYAKAGLFESVEIRPWKWVIGTPA